jgi:glutathione S-transferase
VVGAVLKAAFKKLGLKCPRRSGAEDPHPPFLRRPSHTSGLSQQCFTALNSLQIIGRRYIRGRASTNWYHHNPHIRSTQTLRNMVLKLYGAPTSTCSQRVATVLYEKKVPYQFIPIDLTRGEHKTPQYLEKQPYGQVPYIDDDGYTLYESRAITRYIATKYPNQGPKLIPTDLKEYGQYEQAASTETSNFDPYASGIVYEKLWKVYAGDVTDEAQVKKHNDTLGAKLDVYEKILSKQKYLAGNECTLADLHHLPYGAKLYSVGYGHLIDSRPHVKKWWDELTSRPSWLAVKDGIESNA